ncbi:MAG: hypothetical protein UY37_C0007G0001 [Candidatus Beckwithbacteria bacterium GW2011_GWC2_49_11]|nr:MAG: hypothetical protein UY37_C0007G0001 [Candidatus Beckwithbacteria bacterium GW2011_GWC2_49_11]
MENSLTLALSHATEVGAIGAARAAGFGDKKGADRAAVKAMRKFITDERLKVLRAIRKYHPESIYELAKILKRDTKNVSDDVHYLSDLGLIDIKESKDGRKKTTPVVSYRKILVEIPV